MSGGGEIINRADAFGIVPVAVLENPNLGAAAVRVYTWCRSHSPGWAIRVADLQTRLGIGEKAWRAARDQLVAEKLLTIEKYRGDKGRFKYAFAIQNPPKTQQPAKKNRKNNENLNRRAPARPNERGRTQPIGEIVERITQRATQQGD